VLDEDVDVEAASALGIEKAVAVKAHEQRRSKDGFEKTFFMAGRIVKVFVVPIFKIYMINSTVLLVVPSRQVFWKMFLTLVDKCSFTFFLDSSLSIGMMAEAQVPYGVRAAEIKTVALMYIAILQESTYENNKEHL